jgi:hypothetical protein
VCYKKNYIMWIALSIYTAFGLKPCFFLPAWLLFNFVPIFGLMARHFLARAPIKPRDWLSTWDRRTVQAARRTRTNQIDQDQPRFGGYGVWRSDDRYTKLFSL